MKRNLYEAGVYEPVNDNSLNKEISQKPTKIRTHGAKG